MAVFPDERTGGQFGLMAAREKMKPLQIDWKIRRTFTDGSEMQFDYGYNISIGLLIGFGVGVVSGMFGIGGGSLFVPLMVLLFRFPPHVATATSMFVIMLSSVLGSAVHAWHGNIDWRLFAALAPGALIGGRFGAIVASRLSGRQLLWLLRMTLLAMGVYLIYKGIREMSENLHKRRNRAARDSYMLGRLNEDEMIFVIDV